MIFKSDLLEAINGLSHDVTMLAIRVGKLERQAESEKGEKVKVTIKPKAKRNRGRPRKNAQPRDKSGKFAKK